MKKFTIYVSGFKNLSLILIKDKNKALYWRFKTPEIKEGVFTAELSQTQETITNPNPNNPVTKYQQRIAKTEAINHGKSTSSSPATESISQ